MHDNNSYIKELFNSLLTLCKSQPPFSNDAKEDVDESFITKLEGICAADTLDESSYEHGQQIIERIIANYPHITPALNRDLLWLLGGNCMHFLADEEINHYQQVDELLHTAINNGESLSFQQAKTRILQLH